MKSVHDDKYLGDVISKNIAAKRAKTSRIVKHEICLGPYFIEVALILRKSISINGILTNLEES